MYVVLLLMLQMQSAGKVCALGLIIKFNIVKFYFYSHDFNEIYDSYNIYILICMIYNLSRTREVSDYSNSMISYIFFFFFILLFDIWS